jgi:hypothetical protein
MAKNRMGRPTLEQQRVAQWAKDKVVRLLYATVKVLIDGGSHVTVAASYVMKFPEDFPRAWNVKKEGDINIYRFRANKVLDWLRAHGYTDLDTEIIRAAKIKFTMKEKELDDSL